METDVWRRRGAENASAMLCLILCWSSTHPLLHSFQDARKLLKLTESRLLSEHHGLRLLVFDSAEYLAIIQNCPYLRRKDVELEIAQRDHWIVKQVSFLAVLLHAHRRMVTLTTIKPALGISSEKGLYTTRIPRDCTRQQTHRGQRFGQICGGGN